MSVSLCLWKCCLYCFMAFAKMTEIPHGFGQRTSTYTRVHTHLSFSKDSVEVCSLFLWQAAVCIAAAIVFQKPLFSLFEYANFLSIVIQSHLVSTSSKCCQISASLSFSASFYLSLNTDTSEIVPNSSHQVFCVTEESVLQYLLFLGIIRFYRDYPACSNTPL